MGSPSHPSPVSAEDSFLFLGAGGGRLAPEQSITCEVEIAHVLWALNCCFVLWWQWQLLQQDTEAPNSAHC